MNIKAEIMTGEQMHRALKRMSHEILERNSGANNIVLLGIRRKGLPLAKEIAKNINSIEGVSVPVPVGELDITFYRDDIIGNEVMSSDTVINSELPESVPFTIEGKTVILVDDVIFTGRTTRAALDACSGYGRAARIQLAVLIDRGHRELPIRADYVGKNVPTSRQEHISVRIKEIDGYDGVNLVESQG